METAFTFFDWGVLLIVLLLAVAGVVRGFLYEAIGLLGWVLAVIVVRLFHQHLTLFLAAKTGGETSAAILAFLLLFFGTALAARIAARLLGAFAHRGGLGPVDRLLGLGFGALKGLILATALFLLAQFGSGVVAGGPRAAPPSWLLQSRTAPLLSMTADAMIGWVRMARKGDFFADLPPGHPDLSNRRGEQGYSRSDRDQLDQLLRDGAEKGGQVDI